MVILSVAALEVVFRAWVIPVNSLCGHRLVAKFSNRLDVCQRDLCPRRVDMTELRTKLKFLMPREDPKGIERRRVARVSLLALGGLMVATIFILWWRQWTLEWGNFLLGVTLLGLTQIIVWFRK